MIGELKEALPDAVFTGVLSRAAVAEVFASADLVLFPSETDTAGNVVLEAEASGLPVIVSGSGGPRENMQHGRTGVVCEDADPVVWADTVAALVRDRGRRAAMSAAAREYAMSRSWEKALRPLFQAYREVSANDAVALQVRHPRLDLPGRPLHHHQSRRRV